MELMFQNAKEEWHGTQIIRLFNDNKRCTQNKNGFGCEGIVFSIQCKDYELTVDKLTVDETRLVICIGNECKDKYIVYEASIKDKSRQYILKAKQGDKEVHVIFDKGNTTNSKIIYPESNKQTISTTTRPKQNTQTPSVVPSIESLSINGTQMTMNQRMSPRSQTFQQPASPTSQKQSASQPQNMSSSNTSPVFHPPSSQNNVNVSQKNVSTSSVPRPLTAPSLSSSSNLNTNQNWFVKFYKDSISSFNNGKTIYNENSIFNKSKIEEILTNATKNRKYNITSEIESLTRQLQLGDKSIDDLRKNNLFYLILLMIAIVIDSRYIKDECNSTNRDEMFYCNAYNTDYKSFKQTVIQQNNTYGSLYTRTASIINNINKCPNLFTSCPKLPLKEMFNVIDLWVNDNNVWYAGTYETIKKEISIEQKIELWSTESKNK